MTWQSDPSERGPEPRPGVVLALYSALIDMDPAKLAPLEGTGITPAEREQAEELYAASMTASRGQRHRWLQPVKILTRNHDLTDAPSWSGLFDDLTPESAAELRDLYDALPDGARAEYDRRYGRPDTI